MARLFKKLFSTSSDLLNKEYPENAGNDFQVEVNKTFKSSEDTEAKVIVTKCPKSSTVKVVVEPKGVIKEHNVEVTGKMCNDGKQEGTVTISKLADGKAKVSVKEAFEGALTKYSVELGSEYVEKNVSLNTSLNFSGNNLVGAIKAKGALVYEHDDIAVGVELLGKKAGEDITLESTTVRTEQTGKNYTASFEAVFAKKNSLSFGFYQKVNANLEGASDFKLTSDESGGLSSVARVGFIQKLESNSSLRTRWTVNNQNAHRVGLVYQQTYTNNFKLALGADLNVNQLFGSNASKEDSNKFSMTFSLD